MPGFTPLHDLAMRTSRTLVRCGQCVGCRTDHAREWAIRCVHEAQLHDGNSFVTLTYRDEDLPPDGALRKSDFQNFMKALRRRRGKVRFLASGEYGELGRPHFHAILFGESFARDRYHWRELKGRPFYRSPLLEACWPHGFSSLSDFSYRTAEYVARYVMKKVKSDHESLKREKVDTETGEVTEYSVPPPFAMMSLKPGLGHDWLVKYRGDVYPHDFVLMPDEKGAKKMPVPRYYDSVLERVDPVMHWRVTQEREVTRPEELDEEMSESRRKAKIAFRKNALATKVRDLA